MKKFLILTVLAVAAMTSCQKENGDENKPLNSPELTLTSESTLSFTDKGGNGVITYTLTNPIEGVKVNALSSQEWITEISTDENITFTVLPNESEESREGEITVTYSEEEFVVEITQDGATPEIEEPLFTITSQSTIEIPYQGGEGVVTYTIENPVEGESITYECSADWIEEIVVADDIRFTVALNAQQQIRTTEIILSYMGQEQIITVNQEGAPESEYIEFEASYLQGIYYGNEYGSGYNYYIYLSDVGVTGEDGYKDNSITFRLDIYSDTSSSSGNVVLPEGVYELDYSNSCDPGTFSSMYSICVFCEDGDISGYYGFESGKVTVTENHIEAILEFMSGDVYRVTYSGSLNITMP